MVEKILHEPSQDEEEKENDTHPQSGKILKYFASFEQVCNSPVEIELDKLSIHSSCISKNECVECVINIQRCSGGCEIYFRLIAN